MTDHEERPFLRAIRRHNWLVAGVVMAVVAIGVIVSHWIVFSILIAEIKASRCHCSGMRVEASGNQLILNEHGRDRVDTLAREILKTQGKIKDDAGSNMPRPVQPEVSQGS